MSPSLQPAPAASAFSEVDFRAALGQFATGVAIVTAMPPGHTEPVALTINSFNSVSLDPPLVLWSLTRTASTLAGFHACTHFAINILAARHHELAGWFTRRDPARWQQAQWTAGAGQAPLLTDALACLECLNLRQHDEGDHVVFIGQVTHCTRPQEAAAPLIYHGGVFAQGVIPIDAI